MKKLLLLVSCLLSLVSFSQEDTSNWRVIPSITEWIEEINNWPDSIYQVKNIRILIDEKKDSLVTTKTFVENDTIRTNPPITINKRVQVDGWDIDFFFGTEKLTGLDNLVFKERVRFRNFQGFGIALSHITFEKRAGFSDMNRFSYWNFGYCHFKGDFYLFDVNREADLSINYCQFDKNLAILRSKGNPLLRIENSEIKERVFLGFASYKQLTFSDSKFEDLIFENINVNTALYVYDCEVGAIDLEGAKIPVQNTYIPFELVKNKLYVPDGSLEEFPRPKYQANKPKDFETQKEFDLLIASYKLLLESYQVRGDTKSYNACYVEMRDKETAFYKHVLDKEPSFDNFLTYQLNVFLRVFSDYGTKPTKAISFSIYVILFFALIYLFFPNSWDKHGKNRIVDRYNFFFKYMKRQAGIHEVYLEDQNKELMSYDQFKDNITNSQQKVPKFFTATALPLYKWAISGTKLSASFLKRIDIMKGSWQDLPQHKRLWKSVLLIGAFIIAIIYDLIIKVLNALMLSINTFTTLGFGEIPIKGLPRYLAIIQGFIGWFMLTIFSVSLISQLLN